MTTSIEILFERFRRAADARALAKVFDRTAPELGRVAGYLAGGDRDRAADLLQATWLAAITHASTWDAARPLLPWLLGVLANHARSLRRDDRRRVDGESVLGALLASDDPVRATCDGEFGAALQKALVELPTPFREPVTLHVLHGLTAKEIGEALGRPAGTVRTQIVRGLDRLRQLLPVGLASMGVGVVALSATQLAGIRGQVLTQVGGAVAGVAVPWRFGLAAAATAIVGWAVLTLWGGGDVQPVAVPEVRSDAAAGQMPPAEVGSREALPVAEPVQDPAPRQRKERRRLTVHVRRAEEPKAVAGEWVVLPDVPGAMARTDANGDVVFEDLERRLSFYVAVVGTGANGQAIVQKPTRREFDLHYTLEVTGGESLVVHVVDEAGRPLAGADVACTGTPVVDRTWLPLGTTDASGELHLRNQHATQYRARAAGHGLTAVGGAVPDRQRQLRCKLTTVVAAPVQHGIVRGADGAPVAADLGVVAFGADHPLPWIDRTDAAGRFALDWLPVGPVVVVARTAVGCGLARVERAGTGELEVRIRSGGSAAITTRRGDGATAAQVQVDATYLYDGITELPFLRTSARTDAAGSLRLEHLFPGRWRLHADIDGARPANVVQVAADTTVEWNAVAANTRELRVRLVDPRGEPLSRWNVQPQDAAGRQLGPTRWTDDDGRVHAGWQLPDDAPITLAIFAARDGADVLFPAHRVPGLVPADGEVEIAVPDRCRSSHSVTGRVVGADGLGVAARVFVPSPGAAWLGPRVETAADGAFAIGPFPPGRLQLEIAAAGMATRRLAVTVPAAGDVELGAVQVARGCALVARSAGGGAVPDDLVLTLVDAAGRSRGLRRGADLGFTRSELALGDYTIFGTSRTHHVPPTKVVVAGADVTPAFACVPAPTLVVGLELDETERFQERWSGTLLVTRAGEPLVRRSLDIAFRGVVPAPLEFAIAVPPGPCEVVVDAFTGRTRRGTCDVAAGGGGVVVQ